MITYEVGKFASAVPPEITPESRHAFLAPSIGSYDSITISRIDGRFFHAYRVGTAERHILEAHEIPLLILGLKLPEPRISYAEWLERSKAPPKPSISQAEIEDLLSGL